LEVGSSDAEWKQGENCPPANKGLDSQSESRALRILRKTNILKN